MIRIGIIDDHQLFRKSLALLVNTFTGFKVTINAANGSELFKLLNSQTIDILLLDLNMPVMDGFETCRRVREAYPEIKILIVSQLTSDDSIHRILELDAHGYFTKNSDPEMLEAALHDLNDKGYYFENGVSNFLREAMYVQDNIDTKLPKSNIILSTREIEIVQLAALEYSSLEIAEKLHITLSTVETHRKRIMEKTGSKNFIGVVLFALRNNYLSFSDL